MRYATPGETVDYVSPLTRHSYTLRVPAVGERLRVKREVAAAGATWHRPADLARLVADAIRRLFPDADGNRATLLAMVEEYWQSVRDSVPLIEAIPQGDEAAARATLEKVAEMIGPQEQAMAELQAELADRYPPLRAALAANDVHYEAKGVAAARLLLVGWQGPPGDPRRGRDGLDEASLLLIPADDLPGLGAFYDTLVPTRDEEKNSPSPSSRASSEAAT